MKKRRVNKTPAHSNVARHPLRLIVEHRYETVEVGGLKGELLREALECGHSYTVKQDIFGATHPTRRRCRECAKLGGAETRSSDPHPQGRRDDLDRR